MTAHADQARDLTDEEYWDGYWNGLELPAEIVRRPGDLYLNAILDVFDRHLPAGTDITSLEIGGAPGQYLAYLHRTLGHEVTCLDYSPLGCAKTRENFDLLGIDGKVIQGDLFTDEPTVQHDVVFSLGLIEHFAELEPVVERHLRHLKPGGTLLLGAPNFQGVNGFLARRLAPEVMDHLRVEAMDIDRWHGFEASLRLAPVFRGYVGGFEPAIVRPRRPELDHGPLARAAWAADWLLHDRGRWLRRFNGKAFSGYVLGVYRAP